MEFGLVLSQFTDNWDHMEGDARLADIVGLDSVWLADHLLAPGGAIGPVLEAWTALSYIAASTDQVRLGHLVNCVSFRDPGLLAKMASTLDIASGGRLDLGLGAGWYRLEYDAFGYEFMAPGERVRYFEEYLDALLLLFEGGPATYQGRYVTLEEAYCVPRSLQDPHPPIVVGTAGARMRAITGAKADVWNCPARLLPEIEKARGVVTKAAGGRQVRTTVQIPVAVGRNQNEAEAAYALGKVQMAWMGDIDEIGITGTIDEACEQVATYRDKDVDGLIAVLPGSRARTDYIEAFGELASRF